MRLRTIVGGVFWTGVLLVVSGSIPVIAPFTVALVAVGMSQLLFMTASNSLVQLSSNVAIRGG